MTGIINLITEYSSRLAILPILALIIAGITIFIHALNKKKIIKYIPPIIIGIISIAIGIYSISIFTSPYGLNIAWIAIFLMTTSLVGFCVCFILDLISSLRKVDNKEYRKSKTSKLSSKAYVAKKRRLKGKSNE